MLIQNLVTHSNVLECALIVDTIFTNELPAHRPVRPVRATGQTGSTENVAKTLNLELGRDPSELVDL